MARKKKGAEFRDRVVDVLTVDADLIEDHPRNWRTHDEAQLEALKGEMEGVGNVSVLLVVPHPDKPGLYRAVDGHARKKLQAGRQVRVAVLDLDEAEQERVILGYDALGRMAGADQDILQDLLGNSELASSALTSVLEGLAGLVFEEEGESGGKDGTGEEPPEPRVDRAAELQVQWQTAPGQVWEIPSKTVPGRCHRVVCGDCRNPADVARLLNGARVNVAFTSPPYASQRKYDEESGFRPIRPDDYVGWFQAVQENVKSHLAPDGSWFVNIKEHCEDGQRHLYVKDLTIAHVREWGWLNVDELVWLRKGVPGGWPNRFKNGWEPIFHFALQEGICFNPLAVGHESDGVFEYDATMMKTPAGFLSGKKNGAGRSKEDIVKAGIARPSNVIEVQTGEVSAAGLHTATFPVGLPTFFIKAYSDPGDLIFDPFLGSGTTCVAAEREGRIGYGTELSPKYLAVILQRLADMGLHPRLRTPRTP